MPAAARPIIHPRKRQETHISSHHQHWMTTSYSNAGWMLRAISIRLERVAGCRLVIDRPWRTRVFRWIISVMSSMDMLMNCC